jgi:hypothetical protein
MAVFDEFSGESGGLTASAHSAAVVTPSDSTDLAVMTRAIHVGTAGDVKVNMMKGMTVVLTNLSVGWHPIRVSRIYSTGTTATQITAFW